MSMTPGSVLGDKYVLVRLLGEGGMGAVWEAEHRGIGKHVAVKVLLPQLTSNVDAVARFTREARAAAAVGHPSIIDVYDIGTSEDGSLFLVMEMLRGESLADRLKAQGSLDLGLAAYVLCQVLSALDAAHRKGIVHRDLKPDNVFLVDTRQALPDIKLLDFGISKVKVTDRPEDRLTKTGTILGTPYYMSPEQARGEADVDHRVDVYAAGVILFECLTGRVPFVADNTYALIQKILNDPVPAPSLLVPGLPGPIDGVVARAMERDRARRFASAAEMLGTLLPMTEGLATGRISLPEDWGGQAPDRIPRSSLPAEAATLSERPPTGGARTDLAWIGGARPTAAGKRRLWPVLAAVALAALLGLTALASATRWPGAARHDGRRQEARGPEPAAAPPESEPAPADPPPVETVTVALEGLPEGAVVTLDGAAVEGSELTLERSTALREVRVEADGFAPFRQMVAFDRDRTLEVVLTPERSRPGPRPGGGARPSGAPPGERAAPAPGRPPPSFDTEFPTR